MDNLCNYLPSYINASTLPLVKVLLIESGTPDVTNPDIST